MSLVSELKRRNVLRAGTLYAASAWLRRTLRMTDSVQKFRSRVLAPSSQRRRPPL
jgi:hypothetical protein